MINENEIEKVKNELQRYRYPKLKTIDKLKLWLSNRADLSEICWSRKSKVKRLYSEGSLKIEKMLDLKKLIMNIRTMKTLLKHSLLTENIKEKISNIENHIINLDNSSESS